MIICDPFYSKIFAYVTQNLEENLTKPSLDLSSSLLLFSLLAFLFKHSNLVFLEMHQNPIHP